MMKKTRFILAALILNLSQLSIAESLWFQFKSPRIYRDVTLVCQPEAYETGFYFEGRFSGERLLWAQFIRNPLPQWAPYSAKITLTRQELESIEFSVDEDGQYWIKKIVFDRRLLYWVLRSTGKEYCPPQPLQTLSSPIQFLFETEKMSSSSKALISSLERYVGTRKDGGAYDGKMKLTQKQYVIPQRGF